MSGQRYDKTLTHHQEEVKKLMARLVWERLGPESTMERVLNDPEILNGPEIGRPTLNPRNGWMIVWVETPSGAEAGWRGEGNLIEVGEVALYDRLFGYPDPGEAVVFRRSDGIQLEGTSLWMVRTTAVMAQIGPPETPEGFFDPPPKAPTRPSGVGLHESMLEAPLQKPSRWRRIRDYYRRH